MSIFSDFFKKEAPLLGLQGSGGGLGFLAPIVGGGTTYATGGIISEYESSGTHYRAHIFTTSGYFEVVDASITSVQYLVVAGGGGGGRTTGGGGGAGGFRTNIPGTPHSTSSSFPVSVATYPVTVGAGGRGGCAAALAMCVRAVMWVVVCPCVCV